MQIHPGQRALHWINGREVECVSVETARYASNSDRATSVTYRYVLGDPPGDGHRMMADTWLYMLKGGTAPSGKKHRPGTKARRR